MFRIGSDLLFVVDLQPKQEAYISQVLAKFEYTGEQLTILGLPIPPLSSFSCT
jgi:hypothetical protein